MAFAFDLGIAPSAARTSAAGSAPVFREMKPIRSFSDLKLVVEPGTAAAFTASAFFPAKRRAKLDRPLPRRTILRSLFLERGRRTCSWLMASGLSRSPDLYAAAAGTWGGPYFINRPRPASPGRSGQ